MTKGGQVSAALNMCLASQRRGGMCGMCQGGDCRVECMFCITKEIGDVLDGQGVGTGCTWCRTCIKHHIGGLGGGAGHQEGKHRVYLPLHLLIPPCHHPWTHCGQVVLVVTSAVVPLLVPSCHLHPHYPHYMGLVGW